MQTVPNLSAKAKLAIFFGTTILVIGTGALINNIITAETVEDAIKFKNFTLLSDDKEWEKVLADYTKEIQTQKNLKIANFKGGTGKVQEFKNNCKLILNIKYRIATSKDTINTALWCVKEQTVLDYLNKNKYSILKTEARIADKDNPKWDKKIIAYLEATLENKIPEFEIKESKKDNVIESDRTAFIEKCKKLNQTKHFQKEFEQSYKLSELWCAEKVEETNA